MPHSRAMPLEFHCYLTTYIYYRFLVSNLQPAKLHDDKYRVNRTINTYKMESTLE